MKTDIDFSQSADLSFDSSVIEVLGAGTQMKNINPPSETGYYNFSEDEDFNPTRGLYPLVKKDYDPSFPSGVTISGGKLVFPNDGNRNAVDVDYSILGDMSKGTIQCKWTPNFSTVISGKYLFYVGEDDGEPFRLSIHLQNQGEGITRLWWTLKYSDTANCFSSIVDAWALVSGQTYDLTFTWDMVQGKYKAFRDGILKLDKSTARVVEPMSVDTVLRLGRGSGFNSELNSTIGDLRISTDGLFVDSTSLPVITPPYPTYTTRAEVAVNSPIGLNQLLAFMDTSSSPVGSSLRFILRLNGVLYYHNGADWVVSDGSFDQASSSSDINTYSDSLPVSQGASMKVEVRLAGDGYVTPLISLLSIDFVFDFNPTTPDRCEVFGTVLDNTGSPIEGASITVDGDDFFYDENLIARSSTTYSDSRGKFDIAVVETTTDDKTVNFTIVYNQNGRSIKRIYTGLKIPKLPNVSLGSLVGAL